VAPPRCSVRQHVNAWAEQLSVIILSDPERRVREVQVLTAAAGIRDDSTRERTELSFQLLERFISAVTWIYIEY